MVQINGDALNILNAKIAAAVAIQRESDAKVIAEKDAQIVELEAGYEIQMRNLDAAEKVIADLRTRLEDTGYPLGEIEGLMKVIAALREVLQMGVQLCESGGHGRGDKCPTCHFMREAQKALGTSEQTAGDK
jgi:hypothetical protein